MLPSLLPRLLPRCRVCLCVVSKMNTAYIYLESGHLGNHESAGPPPPIRDLCHRLKFFRKLGRRAVSAGTRWVTRSQNLCLV